MVGRRLVGLLVSAVVVVPVGPLPQVAVAAGGGGGGVPVVVGAPEAVGVVDPGPGPVGSGDFSSPPGLPVVDAVVGGVAGRPVGSGGSGRVVPKPVTDVSGLPLVERGERFDVFDAGGGERVAKLYASPVNVKDAAGVWTRIDPSLVVSASGRLAPRAVAGSVSLAASSGSGSDVVRVGPAGRSVGWRLDGAADVPGAAAGAVVSYAGVWPGVDVEYRVGSGLVKATLVLSRAPGKGKSSWRFPLSLDAGLTPVLLPSGGVAIQDAKGAVVGLVPTPTMWDSKADPLSGDPGVYGPVSLGVAGDAGSGWVLVVSADEGWLGSRDRVFPVHVDPTYNWAGWRDDATVVSGFPNSNYNVLWNSSYGVYENRVGRYDGAWGEGLAEMHFDLSPLSGAWVYGAVMNMYFFHAYTVSPTWFRVNYLGSGFDAGSVTWNTRPAFSGAYKDSAVGRAQWASVDVADWMRNIASGAWANWGFMVEAGTSIGDFKRMASTENNDGSSPHILVSFNRLPSVAAVQAPSPWPGAAPHVPAGGLTLAASATDPDGDAVQYFFRVAVGADAETGVVWQSGWTSAGSVVVPASALPAGRTVYWHVYTSDSPNDWLRSPDWVWSFTPSNATPTVPGLAAPAVDEVLGSLTPTLSTSGSTDANSDPVKYWFRVATGSDGVSGQVVSSGWQTSTSWVVPSGVLKDGVAYSWSVTATDSLTMWLASGSPPRVVASEALSGVGRFRVDLRQGLGKAVPSDAVGGVNVNLFNGNLTVSAGSPSMSTLGGPVGVSFTYNSAKLAEKGLVGSYYDGLPAARDFPVGEAPRLVRTDTAVAFDWGAGSPFAPAVGVDQFRIRWVGFVTVPASGAYLFGATHDDGVRVSVGGTRVLDRWVDSAVANDYTGAVAVQLSVGVSMPIVVDYFEDSGQAQMTLMTRMAGDGGVGAPVPSSWLSPNPPVVPTGWSVSADLDGDGGYTAATVTEGSVALIDASGSTHTYTRRSDGSYSPPPGQYGTLSKNGDGELVLQDGDGRDYRFGSAGQVLEATVPTDDRKPASAQYEWAGSPARLSKVTDPASGRDIRFTYNVAGSACPAPPAGGYDPASPAGMLCQVEYTFDNTITPAPSTVVAYKNGQLAAIIDPGGEVTQFRYTDPSGKLTGYRDPLAYDWVAAGAGRDTDATWSLIGYDSTGRVSHLQSAEPSGVAASPSGRLGHTYTYPAPGANPPVVTVMVDGGPTSTITMDSKGRPVSATNPAGQTTTQGWTVTDLPAWSTDHTGRTTATTYDTTWHPTDTWGPWPDACFDTSADSTSKTPKTTSGCRPVMPHATTAYDQGLSGLAAQWHTTTNLTGAPAGHNTTTPGGYGSTPPHSVIPTGTGYSGRLTGYLTLPAAQYTFAADQATAGDDGARVYIDDQPALATWDTVAEAVAVDTPLGYWRGSSTAPTVGTTSLTALNATFDGPPITSHDPQTSTHLSASGHLALPGNYLRDATTSAPGIEAWFQTTSAGAIFGYQNSAGTSYVPSLYVGTDGKLHGGFWPTPSMTTPASVTDGAWHHVVLTATAADSAGNRDMLLYLDGQLAVGTRGTLDMLDMSNNQFGSARTAGWGAGCADWCLLNGNIAEMAIYTHTLDYGRVVAHYQAGHPTYSSTAQHTGQNTDGRFALTDGKPHRFRVDYRNPSGASTLTLTATPVETGGTPTGAPISLGAGNLTPGYGLATTSTVEDSGGATPSITSSTSYADAATGIDPALGLATARTVDPGGLALTRRIGYEPYGVGSLLRPVTTRAPSGPASEVTTAYYAAKTATTAAETRTNPCPGGTTSSQHGLAKVTVTPAPATGPAVATEVVYDVWGRVVASGYRDGGAYPTSWTCSTYDARGRAVTVTTPAYGTDTSPRTVTSTYAVAGDPLTTSVTDPSGTTTITSDLLGRTTTYTHTVPGISGASVTTTTTYDTIGRVSAATTTASAGGASTVGTTYLPDGRVNTITVDTITVATLSYDATTKDLAGVSYPQVTGGLSVGGIVKNDAGAVTGTTRTVGARSVVETLTRSRAGRITRTVSTDSALGAGGTVDWAYTYDGATRLTTAVLAAAGARPVLTLGYGYASSGGCGADPNAGANGSRVTATRQVGTGPVATSTSCTDNAARLTSVTGAEAIAASGLSYDVRGNATQIGQQHFTYDAANRVTATSHTDIAPTITLTYGRDSLGRVATRTATGAETAITRYGYTTADDSPDLQLTTTGAIGERYLPLPGGTLYTKRYATGTGTDTYATANLHGDATLSVTPTGTVTTAGLIYEPFGQPLNPTTASVDLTNVPTTRTDTTTTDAWHGAAQRGYEHTNGLNQTLMGARTYLPALGIFTARDPIPGGNTTTYTYPQNPIGSKDLTGTRPIDWDGNDYAPAELSAKWKEYASTREIPLGGRPSLLETSKERLERMVRTRRYSPPRIADESVGAGFGAWVPWVKVPWIPFLPADRAGVNLHGLFITKTTPSAAMLEHEAMHSVQWLQFDAAAPLTGGLNAFPIAYWLAGSDACFNSFEQSADLSKGGYRC